MANLIRLAERLFLIALSAMVVGRLLPEFTPHPEILILLASELAAVFFLLIQRKGEWTVDPYATTIAFAGTGASLLIMPEGVALAPAALTAPLITLGTGIALIAKLSLRRSFGIVPANRGVKASGAYRFVRHPMYFGYVLSHIGFLLIFFSAWNLAIYITTWTLLYLRANEEEKFLMRDPEYAAYASKVRARLIPGVI